MVVRAGLLVVCEPLLLGLRGPIVVLVESSKSKSREAGGCAVANLVRSLAAVSTSRFRPFDLLTLPSLAPTSNNDSQVSFPLHQSSVPSAVSS